MHPHAIADRQFEALKQTTNAMTLLSERHGIALPPVAQERDKDIEQMLRWEAVATFMQELAAVPAPTVQIDVNSLLSIEGLSKTSIKAIKANFGVTDGDPE